MPFSNASTNISFLGKSKEIKAPCMCILQIWVKLTHNPLLINAWTVFTRRQKKWNQKYIWLASFPTKNILYIIERNNFISSTGTYHNRSKRKNNSCNINKLFEKIIIFPYYILIFFLVTNSNYNLIVFLHKLLLNS